MKRLFLCMILGALGASLISCGTASKQIRTKSLSERMDAFREITEEEPIPKGFSDLIIKAHIKTHLEGYSFFESKDSPHGKPEYPFLLNIDGQAAIWNVKGRREITPIYDKWGRITPEGGEGMRYELHKRIRLPAGSYKIFFALPAEDHSREFDITLEEGRVRILEFKPIYNIDVTTYKTQSKMLLRNFLYELKEYEGLLDGKSLRQFWRSR